MVSLIMQDIFAGFEPAFSRQLYMLCGQEVNITICQDILKKAKDRYFYCLSRKRIKHFPSCILTHADEYTSFLVFLSSQAWRDGSIELAEFAYLVNRRLNNFACFYTRQMPDVFHLEHPMGSVIGQAKLGEYLVVYQGVSVGGDLKLRYPESGDGVVLFAKSTVIGAAKVGSNCAIGAGVQVYGGTIPSDTAVSLRNGFGVSSSTLSWSVQKRFFKT
jgi:serine O-acetyltransferase